MSFRGIILLGLLFLFASSLGVFTQNLSSQKPPGPDVKAIENSHDFVDGKTIVAEIAFTGLDRDYPDNDDSVVQPISPSDLSRKLREHRALIEANDRFSSWKTEQTIKLTMEYLAELGYLKAAVVALGEKLAQNRMKLTFAVERGPLIGISQVLVNGNRNFMSSELADALIQCLGDDWRTSEWRKIQYCANSDLRKFMFSKGYLKARIESVRRRFVNRSFEIVVEVNEGAVHRYGDISVAGATVFSEKEIIEMLGRKPGDIVNASELRDFAYETLPKLYGDRGYVNFMAEFDPEYIQPVSKEFDPTVNIKFALDEGRQFKVGRVDFIGLSDGDARNLKADFPLKEGDVYNKRKFAEWCKKINETGEYKYFDPDTNVEIFISEKSPVADIRIKISKEAP